MQNDFFAFFKKATTKLTSLRGACDCLPRQPLLCGGGHVPLSGGGGDGTETGGVHRGPRGG